MMAFHPRKSFLQLQLCIGDRCSPGNQYFPSPPPPPPPPPNPLFNQTNQNNNNLSGLVILLLCGLSAALLLLLLGYLTFVKKHNSQMRSQSTSDDEHFVDENHVLELNHPIIWYINTVGLQQSVIDSIAVFKYKRGDGMIEGTDCSVCLNEFQEDDTLRLLPKCNHAFHIPCIDTWLSSNETCPLCRAPIVNSSSQNSAESNSNDLEENLENCGEVGSTQVGEVETNEINIGEETNIESRVLSDLANHCSKIEEETVRRSVSMDLAYASRIYHAVANTPRIELEGCSSTQLEELKKPNSEVVAKRLNKNSSIYRLMRSSSFGRCLQKRPIAMKRSFSSSGKKFSSPRRFSRSQDMIPPLR